MPTQKKIQTAIGIKKDATEYASNTTLVAADYSAYYIAEGIEDRVERMEVESNSQYGLIDSIESKSKGELNSFKLPLLMPMAKDLLSSVGKVTTVAVEDATVDDTKISIGGTYTGKVSSTTFTIEELDGNNKDVLKSSKPTMFKIPFKVGEMPYLETGFEGLYSTSASGLTFQGAKTSGFPLAAYRNASPTLNGVTLDITGLEVDIQIGTECYTSSATATGYSAPEAGNKQITATIKCDPLKTSANTINALMHSNSYVPFVFTWGNIFKITALVAVDSSATKFDADYGRYDLVLRCIVDSVNNTLIDLIYIV